MSPPGTEAAIGPLTPLLISRNYLLGFSWEKGAAVEAEVDCNFGSIQLFWLWCLRAMAESAPEIVAEEDPRSEEQKNLAKLHEAVIQRLTQVPERIAAIQASFFDLKGLSNLMDLTKEMQLDPTPCPDPAKELAKQCESLPPG